MNSISFHRLVPLAMSMILGAFALNARAAIVPKDFLGISWGDSQEKAKSTMLARPNTALSSESPARLEFSGGVFAGYPIETCGLDFADGFSAAQVSFVAAQEMSHGIPLAREQFDKLSKALMAKYGKYQSQLNRGMRYRQIWTWNITDPVKKQKATVTIILAYKTVAPNVCSLEYSRLAVAADSIPPGAKLPAQPKRGDL